MVGKKNKRIDFRIPGAVERAKNFFTPREKELIKEIDVGDTKITDTFGVAYADELV